MTKLRKKEEEERDWTQLTYNCQIFEDRNIKLFWKYEKYSSQTPALITKFDKFEAATLRVKSRLTKES